MRVPGAVAEMPRLTWSGFGSIIHLHRHKRSGKMKVLLAFLAGMFVATVGISGVASAVDKAVGKTQEVMKETVK
jgi:hypothetical protein